MFLSIYGGEHCQVTRLGDVSHEAAQEQDVTDVQGEAAERRAGESVPGHLQNSQEEEPELDREGCGPGQVVEGVVVPDVELVVEAPGEHHSDKVAHEERQD